jgi:hypothetical protein
MSEQPDSAVKPAKPRKGLAIASQVIGILSFATGSFFLVGTVTSVTLGIIALRKARRQPEVYGGEQEAKDGLLYSTMSLATLLIGLTIMPNFIISQHAARETAALREVQAINSAQIQYAIIKGHGGYTDLRTLGEAGLVDSWIASGQKGGYIFTSNPVEGGDKPMYDVTARPNSTGNWGIGNRSFYTNESEVVYDADGDKPPTATLQNRVPANGSPLQ